MFPQHNLGKGGFALAMVLFIALLVLAFACRPAHSMTDATVGHYARVADRPVNAVLTVASSCCSKPATGVADAPAPQSCSVLVSAQYCHYLPPNPPYYPVPVQICYWVRKTVQGQFDAARGCCLVTLSDSDFPGLAGTYCVKGSLTIGPVPAVAQESAVPAPPPMMTVETCEGSRKMTRIVPPADPSKMGAKRYRYEGGRLVVDFEPDSN